MLEEKIFKVLKSLPLNLRLLFCFYFILQQNKISWFLTLLKKFKANQRNHDLTGQVSFVVIYVNFSVNGGNQVTLS